SYTSSEVASTETIPDIPSLSRPSEPVLETITSPIRDDDTGGGSFHESPPSPPPATLPRSLTVGVTKEPLTLTSLLALFLTYVAIPAADLDSAGGLDSASGVISAGGADSASELTSTGILVDVGPTVSAEPSSPIRDPAKGKAVATPSSPVTAPTDKELADQQAAILEAERQELLEQELK
nr:hypothetical protein [Tanacetum cinerariifolium]